MKIEFNKGKVEKEVDNDSEVEVEVEEKPKKEFIRQNDLKKPLLKIAIIIAAVLGLLLIILLIASLMTPKTRTFEDIEAIMKQAAMDYYGERKNYLPTEVGDVSEVDVSNLVAAGKMKDLSEYTGENVSCSGRVEVEKTEDSYVYSPFLDCGEDYITIEMYKKIESDNEPVTSGYGLYSMNGAYVFRGETVNNYLKLGNTMWRIVKINNDNTTTLIEADTAQVEMDYISKNFPWDNRFNLEKNSNVGIANFGPSRIHEFILRIYDEDYNLTSSDGVKILTKEDKEKLAIHDLCVGKRSSSDPSKDNTPECKTLLEKKYVGLLTASDYMNASLDTNCKTTTSSSCQNYNYLNISKQWWLMTASTEDTYSAYSVYDGIYARKASSNAGIRLVVRLKNNVFYKSGTGTEADPYIVK